MKTKISLIFSLFILINSSTALAKAINTCVRMETNIGNIDLTLYDYKAPETVKNFLTYIDNGFYNNTIFHRVIENFMIQGGGFNT